MPEHADITSRIALDGDWSLAGITSRLKELTTHLETLRACRDSSNTPLNLEVCVGGVETIDASGHQLLAVFLRLVSLNSFAPMIVNQTDHFRSSVAMLGFDTDLKGGGIEN